MAKSKATAAEMYLRLSKLASFLVNELPALVLWRSKDPLEITRKQKFKGIGEKKMTLLEVGIPWKYHPTN